MISQNTLIRQKFNAYNNVPVYREPGESYPPFVVGRRGGYFTKGGTRISHPSAYSKKGWSNMIYHCDSRKIYVGEYYVAQDL